MHDHHSSGAIAMRVGVFFSGTTVSCPAGVAYAVSSVERLKPDDFFQVAKFALCPANLQAFTVATDCDSGRIVAAIFQAPEAIQNDGNDPLLSDVSHNSTHMSSTPI